ncbi:MAG: acyl carrier protein [Methylophilaceae bacterium]
MNAEVISEKVREIVQETIDSSGLGIEVDDEMSLIEGGLLDSMSIVKLVQELQQTFDIDIDFSDITISNFDSISALNQYVEARKAGA